MPEKIHNCVESVLEDNPDYSESRAWAICRAQFELDVEQESVGDVESLEVLNGIDEQGLDELAAAETTTWHRAECDRGTVWADTNSGDIVYQAIERQARVRFSNFGGDPFQDEATLEGFVDALRDAGADRVLLGDEEYGEETGIHDRPVVVEGLSLSEAEQVWEEFEADAVAIGGPQVVEEQQGPGFEADVFRIVQAEDDEMDLEGDLMGIGCDFPNAGVYVDWNIDAWPDDEQLQEAHVSDYGSIEDLEQATGGIVEPLETVDAVDASVVDGEDPAAPTDS